MKCVGVLNDGKDVVILLKEPWTWQKKKTEISSWFFDMTLGQAPSQDWFAHFQIQDNDHVLAHWWLNCAFESTCPGIWTDGSLWGNLPAPLLKQHPDFQRQWRESGRGIWSHSPNSCSLIYSPLHAALFNPLGKAHCNLKPRCTFNKTLAQFVNG